MQVWPPQTGNVERPDGVAQEDPDLAAASAWAAGRKTELDHAAGSNEEQQDLRDFVCG